MAYKNIGDLMSRYIIVDTANLFFRCLHGGGVMGDTFSKASLSLHIMLRSIRKIWREHKADHVVFCLEGKSWRYGVYPQYKASRKVARALQTPKEQEENQVYSDALDELLEFLTTKSNCTVLKANGVEGDDFIARWVQNHQNDHHIIVSGDTDFIQLLAPNVCVFDGVRELMIKTDGVFDPLGQPLEFGVKSNGHIRVGKTIDLLSESQVQDEWWKWALFLKCIRGDAGDGIFSAYPKVRENKLKAAWNDRFEKGYDWNNLMLQTFKAGDEEKSVRTEFAFNESLIKLDQQPQYIKDLMDQTIIEAVSKPPVANVGIHFMRFCAANGLVNIGKEAPDHAAYLNAKYSE